MLTERGQIQSGNEFPPDQLAAGENFPPGGKPAPFRRQPGHGKFWRGLAGQKTFPSAHDTQR